MTLAFSTVLNKVPTFFVDKIQLGLVNIKLITYPDFVEIVSKYDSYNLFYQLEKSKPHVKQKIHTIRRDEFNRWEAGNKIHFVINNRTPQRYQFAPVVKCTSTQEINIVYWYNPKTQAFDSPKTYVDGKELDNTVLLKLATNDGFDSISDFYAYFKGSFNGKIIHWTNTKY